MSRLSNFLWERSRGQYLLIHALHSDYNTYCTFSRRAKITTYEMLKCLEMMDIKVLEVVGHNSVYDRDVRNKLLRHIFCYMKENKSSIIKEVRHDYSTNS